jgi:hypothetical protein
MRNHRNHVADLAAKVGAGNPGARLQLRKQMESQMVFIVRRTLQTGKNASSLDRRILAEARRLDAQRNGQACRDPEQRIRAIADAMCHAVLTNLRPALSDPRQAHETVFELAPSAC